MTEFQQKFLQQLEEHATAIGGSIAFPDATDERTLLAACTLASRGIAQPMLVGDPMQIRRIADAAGIPLPTNIALFDPAAHRDTLADEFAIKQRSKPIQREQAQQRVLDPLTAAGLLLDRGDVRAVVAGSLSTTSDVLRAALSTVGLAPGSRTMSSYFVMVLSQRVLFYADCGVIPDPTSEQLAEIAIATADNYRRILREEPRVAFLRFRRKGALRIQQSKRFSVRCRSPNRCDRTSSAMANSKQMLLLSRTSQHARLPAPRSLAVQLCSSSQISTPEISPTSSPNVLLARSRSDRSSRD